MKYVWENFRGHRGVGFFTNMDIIFIFMTDVLSCTLLTLKINYSFDWLYFIFLEFRTFSIFKYQQTSELIVNALTWKFEITDFSLIKMKFDFEINII